ncbi:glycosyltransferase family 2 protein [Bifidobacterium aquikefiri]|uniref:Glycosyl transferase n=2 Tax=Bifidobacterium aquikefiri TaxID=1653207 RepID=A0A261G8L0_9BIFI|nr:glycosyltransferase [Bifidobacterium aquikefiri]OZG67762.1 glycosyl transferase [Bifidobacterium aquikefiri]
MSCGISFIIPVYNAENYLRQTLDSIVKQDDGNIEIICVNDGSTDNSFEMLESYSQQYACIHVISQRNSGITVARNVGLRQAQGDWICFIDDDDILAQGAVNLIENKADPTCQIVYFQYSPFSTDSPNQQDNDVKGIQYFTEVQIRHIQADCINRFRSNKPVIPHSVLPTPWAKIYRHEFLQNFGFHFRDEVTHEEDVVFNFELLSKVRKAMQIDSILYYYRWSISSESHRYRPQILSSVNKTLDAYKEIIQQDYPQRKDIAELYRYRVLWELLYCIYLGPMHAQNPHSYSQRKLEFINLLNGPRFKGIFSSVSTLRFEWPQATLSTLIKYRQFWLLNLLGKLKRRI